MIMTLVFGAAYGAFADQFGFLINTSTLGYDSDYVFKSDTVPHSKAMVSVTMTKYRSLLGDGTYAYLIVDPHTYTNFLVCASNTVQITENRMIKMNQTGMLPFYNAYHAGNVYLRANSTIQNPDYSVSGVWDPNCD